jgi:hypothetical protein
MEYKNNTLSNTHRFAEADSRIKYFGKEHALYALISILIIPFIISTPSISDIIPDKNVSITTLQVSLEHPHHCFLEYQYLYGEVLQLL